VLGLVTLIAVLRYRRENRAQPRGDRLTMWSGFPLFPEQASTMAGRVDAL
jgi:hypothetical protein